MIFQFVEENKFRFVKDWTGRSVKIWKRRFKWTFDHIFNIWLLFVSLLPRILTQFHEIPIRGWKGGQKSNTIIAFRIVLVIEPETMDRVDCKTKNRQFRSTTGGYRSVSVEILWNRVILVKIDRISLYFFVTCRSVVNSANTR